MNNLLKKNILLVLSSLSFMSVADDIETQELPLEQCSLNNAESCENIGMYYINVVGDDAKALPYLQKGCDLNAKDSCTLSGNIFAEGKVVQKDIARALGYYEKACELKEGIACNLLGSFYENGENVNKDIKKAIYYYTRSCNEGDWAQACDILKELSEK